MAAAATQFETGFFSSPSDLKTAADEVDAELTNIDNAIDGNESIPQDEWDGFGAFRSQWKGFYSANFSSLLGVTAKWLTTDLQAQLVSYEGQAQTWGQQMQGYGVTVPGGLIAPADNSLPSVLPSLGISWEIGLVIILAIVIAWKVL